MTKGPNRILLDQYLDTAAEGKLRGAGFDWKQKAKDLKKLGDALGVAAKQAELRIGEQTLTGPAIRVGMEKASTSMIDKADQLHAAGEALTTVATQISDARDSRDALADLGEKPPTYQAPANTTGVEPTPEEIQAQADASQARQNERNTWQDQYEKQEAKALALRKEMDATFLGAIPPMQDIHGQKDPTEPPPQVPSGPGGPYLPGTQAPPVTGGGAGGGEGGRDGARGEIVRVPPRDNEVVEIGTWPPQAHPPVIVTCPPNPPVEPVLTQPPTHPTPLTPLTPPTSVPEIPTTTVSGTPQDGITHSPTGSSVSAPGTTPGAVSGSGSTSLGTAGAVSGVGAMTGAVRGGAVSATSSTSAPVRPIGSTGRGGSAAAISRAGATSTSSSAAARGATSASTAAGRTAAGRTGASGTTAARGATAGSAGGRGSTGTAGGRGAAAGATSGSRSATGSRGSRGAAAAAGTPGARGARKGDRDDSTSRDSLVYEQDWLGDDDAAPGVLG